jgi:hypothetical protein
VNPKDVRTIADPLDAEPYRLSAPLCTALGVEPFQRDVLPLVSAHLTELAELFWREARTVPGVNTWQKVEEWTRKHFGRILDLAPRGVLLREIRAHGEYAGNARTLALFDSIGEQRRFETATAEVKPRGEENVTRYLERVCVAAGATIGAGVRQMPHAPGRAAWERSQNAQKAALAERQPGEEG